jgi:HSP20 family protein
MALTQYRDRNWLAPWKELDQVSRQLNRFFNDSGLDVETNHWLPPVNVEETKSELVLTAELPGIGQDDVEVELENNVLTIRGKKEETREESEERRFHVWERRYGTFQRSFTLPRTVSADDIAATFEDGVLHVHMPKVAEAKGRTIQIRSRP